MRKQTLYIICGLPYSGKTTFAQTLADKTGSDIVAYDWIWAKEKPALQVPDLDNKSEWNEILAIAYNNIRQKLRDGKSVVFDNVNHSKKDRETLKNIAQKAGARAIIVYLNTPFNVMQQRRVENLLGKTRHHVKSVNLKKVYADWEPPVGEKDVVEYSPGQDLDQWINSLRSRNN